MLQRIYLLSVYCLLAVCFGACSVTRPAAQQLPLPLLSDSNLRNAHVGIAVYNTTRQQSIYRYQADKYFIPASTVKLFTCYAAMKYLGDSLVSAYASPEPGRVAIVPNGDPSFLHPDFERQPLLQFLQKQTLPVHIATTMRIHNGAHIRQESFQAFGKGWSWDDHNEPYMPERSVFPMYGNVARFYFDSAREYPYSKPAYFFDHLSDQRFLQDRFRSFSVIRGLTQDTFWIYPAGHGRYPIVMPYKTDLDLAYRLLADELPQQEISRNHWTTRQPLSAMQRIHSQPVDSLLRPMMHRSDNFFAEQLLLMLSHEMLGTMSDAAIIDTLLSSDLRHLPQKPRWVDGSGLSRYNLFSPDDFVYLLGRMQHEFDWNRITTILPTGGQGTLGGYYADLGGRIFAKTGTLSNNVSLGGFLISQRGDTIVFSVMVNNHMGDTNAIRRAVEKMLTEIAAQN